MNSRSCSGDANVGSGGNEHHSQLLDRARLRARFRCRLAIPSFASESRGINEGPEHVAPDPPNTTTLLRMPSPFSVGVLFLPSTASSRLREGDNFFHPTLLPRSWFALVRSNHQLDGVLARHRQLVGLSRLPC
jgi:hypothetical protein